MTDTLKYSLIYIFLLVDSHEHYRVEIQNIDLLHLYISLLTTGKYTDFRDKQLLNTIYTDIHERWTHPVGYTSIP